MEKKIKIVYLLTIVAIITLCCMQGYWLYTRYQYTLQSNKEELFQKIVDIMKEESELRRDKGNSDMIVVSTNSNINIAIDSMSILKKKIQFNINVINKRNNHQYSNLKNIVNVFNSNDTTYIKKYKFIVDNHNNEQDAFDALARFTTNIKNPFDIAILDSLIMKHNIEVIDINTAKADTMVWQPSKIENNDILGTELTIIYPYDIFEGKTVRITCPVQLSPIITKMLDVLLISILVSVLLITCLISQILTIKRQLKLEKLRADFIHTMIHELKRPISTLKMCFSFIRNEKMMEDKNARHEILEDSYNELNNLSSYFSKLRDITFNDVTEIPLTLTPIDLGSLLRECVDKMNKPSNKNISVKIINESNITIAADKMHLANIINNLLENAVKYSKENVNIEIDYKEEKDESILISIKDNGIGIPPKERKYVFDKFYRSTNISNKNIPGIGLGLSYVKLLITAHKGEISMKSEEGVGTIFTIKLPQ